MLIAAVLGVFFLAVVAVVQVLELFVYLRNSVDDRERLNRRGTELEARAGRDESTQAQLLSEIRKLRAAATSTLVDERRSLLAELLEHFRAELTASDRWDSPEEGARHGQELVTLRRVTEFLEVRLRLLDGDVAAAPPAEVPRA